MLRLFLVSTLTLGVLVGFLMTAMSMVLLLSGAPSSALLGVLLLTVILSLVGWWIGPWFTDLLQGWTFHLEKLEFPEFEARYPNTGAFIRDCCKKNGLPLPRMRLINDDTPTAYTYGSLPFNSRVVLSEGLFRFLSDDEVNAVAAHELGHIKHYDFAVMTFASTLLQVLYQTHWILRSAGRRNRRGGGLVAASLVAYLFYILGTYVVLYLSRTREYMADRFSAQAMGSAAPLQKALVKIAYGLTELGRVGKMNKRLVESTRTMGISDPKGAAGTGNGLRSIAAHVDGNLAEKFSDEDEVVPLFGDDDDGFDPKLVEPVMVFDIFNPWARVSELSSTHPLTGRRLKALNETDEELGREPLFDFKAVDARGAALDKSRLYGGFVFEVMIYFLPWLLPLPLLAGALFYLPSLGMAVAAVGAGMVAKGAWRFSTGTVFEATTMYELMCDPYASPLRGRPVQLEGEIVGKATAGAMFAEDLTMKDRSGGLVMLNYESWFPILGNLFAGLGKMKAAIGHDGRATGWFRRSMYQFVDLSELRLSDGTLISSWTRFWGFMGGFVVLGIGTVLTLVLLIGAS